MNEVIYDIKLGKKLKYYFYAVVYDGIAWGVIGYDGYIHYGCAEMIAARFRTKDEAECAVAICPGVVDYRIRSTWPKKKKE